MVLLFSSSSIQSTIQVISFNISADYGDGADYDGGNTAIADRDDASNEEDQHSNRENGKISHAKWNPDNDGRIFYMPRM